MHEVRFAPTLEGWLAAATAQLATMTSPSEILWTEATSVQYGLPGLFNKTNLDIPIDDALSTDIDKKQLRIPRRLMALGGACHRDGRK